MTRKQLEHVLRASAAITGADELIVIGSQSIHGPIANPPLELTLSMEADPEDANLIEGSIGEGSPHGRRHGLVP